MKENVIINFSRFPFCFRCNRVKKHNFTNYLKDNKDFFDKFKEIVKDLCMNYNNYKKDEEFERWFEQNLNDYEIWQLGNVGGIRLIGIINLNVFNVLFIDYHHLLYSSKKYNQLNYDKYKFCPITNYEKEKVK